PDRPRAGTYLRCLGRLHPRRPWNVTGETQGDRLGQGQNQPGRLAPSAPPDVRVASADDRRCRARKHRAHGRPGAHAVGRGGDRARPITTTAAFAGPTPAAPISSVFAASELNKLRRPTNV